MNAAQGPTVVASALADPVRRDLLAAVMRSAAPVGRDQAAEALGIPRATAAFHLDRLVDAGLLVTEFKRTSGRTGPGAGRPAKLYSPASAEISLTFPSRRYDLAAELLAAAIDRAERAADSPRAALAAVSGELGRELGGTAETLAEVLESTGYEPVDDGDGGLVLANCPFKALALEYPETICGANTALLEGAAATTDAQGLEVRFEPRADCCCVHLVPSKGN